MMPEEQIRRALARAKTTDMTAADVMEMVRQGRATLLCLGETSASWTFPSPGVCHVLHVYGPHGWRSTDADLYWSALGREMIKKGARTLTWTGRPGWARMLERSA